MGGWLVVGVGGWSPTLPGCRVTWCTLLPAPCPPPLAPCLPACRDLHTVDDGVWAHLLPTLRRHEGWDVLVAHYLGVRGRGGGLGFKYQVFIGLPS